MNQSTRALAQIMLILLQTIRQSNIRLKIAAALGVLAAISVAFYLRAEWLERKHVLRVGFSQFAPYIVENGTAEPGGLAVEMIRRAAAQARIPIRWVKIDDVDRSIRTRQVDMYPLGTLTPERKQEFHVSEPWWENEIALISLEGKALSTAEDTAGKRVGLRGLPIVKKMAERLFPKAQLIVIPRMEDLVGFLCAGQVEGFFLDLRLLQSQMLKGDSHCEGHALHVASIPRGSLSLGTLAHPDLARTADHMFEEIAQLSADGTLSEIASQWSLYNTYQSRHLKDALDAQHRAEFMHYGLGATVLVLIVVSIQTTRIRRARLQAEESNQRFNAFMRYMPAIAFIKSAEGRFSFVSEALCKLFQMEPEQLIGKSDDELWPLELAMEYRTNDLRVLAQNRAEELLETAISSNGEERSFLSHKFPFNHPSGERFLGGVSIDITERLRAENALKLSQFSIDCAEDSMLWIDDQGRVFNANRSAHTKLGYEREELIGLHVSEIDTLLPLEAFASSRERLKAAGSLIVESVHRRKDGVVYPVEVRQNFLAFQDREISCCMVRDITERKQAEQELAYQARHDALTGLPNRRLLETRLAEAIETASAQGSLVSVVYLDLDGFKLVNDTLGHGAGDQLLQQVAVRLGEALQNGDMLFRMGGDEFTAVLTGATDQGAIATVAHKLLANLHGSFRVEGHDLCLTASVGVSMFPRDGRGESELLRKADAAMYQSKRQGKNRIQFFTPEMGHAASERLELENCLRRALERKEFSLVYQPELCLKTGKIVRHEALLRWTHPVLGSVPPSKFIPVAEETTLIVPIGRWVLEQACRRASEWQTRGAEGVGVAVNVSLVQFQCPDFIDTLVEVLSAAKLAPELLELELKESVLMAGLEDVLEKITRLRALGVRVSIDDFGTGYSSLSHLRQLPIDSVKIDRSLIRDITSDPSALSLSSALISIAHSLGMKVVVEGIETQGQLEIVQRLGCEVGQGYYLGMPTGKPLLMTEYAAA